MFTKGMEIQIIDRDHPQGIATRHGDVFAIHGATFVPDKPHPQGWMRSLPSEKRVKPQGEWNHYRVESRDGVVTLAVNGKVVSGGSAANPMAVDDIVTKFDANAAEVLNAAERRALVDAVLALPKAKDAAHLVDLTIAGVAKA